jgi:hypothetical protein
VLHQLDYAFIATGEGFRCPYGFVHGGSSISTKSHGIYFDDTMNLILVEWQKKPTQRFYVSPQRFHSFRFVKDPAEAKRIQAAAVIPQGMDAPQAKRKPGRPKKTDK